MSKIQVVGKGFCRGDEWSIRETLDKKELITLMEKSIEMSDDEFCDFECDLEDIYDDYDTITIIMSAITNGDFIIDGSTRVERTKKNLDKIKANQPFIVELEEHTFAYGPTKKAAMIAYAEYALNCEDEDTDW